jgi:hypothetical protein
MKTVFFLFSTLMFSSLSYSAGYGDAGCGLGSVIFGKTTGFTQVFAATTNGSSGNQTFGISSGTSNCGGTEKGALAFIEVNKASLQNDISKGHGETVTSLSEIYGCKKSEQFGKILQTNYKVIFKSNEAQDINNEINNIIKKNDFSCRPKV